jgi:hypothetical protein
MSPRTIDPGRPRHQLALPDELRRIGRGSLYVAIRFGLNQAPADLTEPIATTTKIGVPPKPSETAVAINPTSSVKNDKSSEALIDQPNASADVNICSLTSVRVQP